MTSSDFAKEIKKGLRGGYVFCGEEAYLKNHYLHEIKKTLFENGSADEVSGEGKTVGEAVSEVSDLVLTPSFTSDKKLTVLYDLDLRKVKESDVSSLEFMFESVEGSEETVVILDTRPENFDRGTDKKPSKLVERLSKVATVVVFARESAAKLSAWAMRRFAADRVSVSKELCDQLVDRVGRDMFSLKNEIDKLVSYVSSEGRNTVTRQDVEYISVINTEIEAFDFSNAVLDGNTEKAMAILSDSKLRKEAPELILGSITRVYGDMYTVKCLSEIGLLKADIAKECGMHEYKTGLYLTRTARLSRASLEKAVELCHEADIKIKSTPLDKYNVLDELLVNLYFAGFVK